MAGVAAVRLLLLQAAAALALAAAAAAGGPEAATLLAFRGALRGPHGAPPEPLSQWATTTPGPCAGAGTGVSLWYGVTCHQRTGQVRGLRLEYLGLQGPAPDMAPLAALRGLRALSIANNNLTGPFPDVSMLPALKMLYMSRNKLDGGIPPAAFAHMRGLRKLFLSDNAFTGPIPTSITSPKLLVLQLSKNRFDGPLPDFNQKELRLVDVSDNNLSGPIPPGLRRFDAKSFQGNKNLCGPPVGAPCPEVPILASPSPSPLSSSWWSPRSLKILMIIALVVVVVGALLAFAGALTAMLARRREATTETQGGGVGGAAANAAAARMKATPNPAVTVAHGGGGGGGEQQPHVTVSAVPAKRGGRRDDHGRLVFIQEGRERFELEDLLRASAEVLGSGSFGASYKATLVEGQSMVVKRFKEMNGVGRQDFNEHMRRLGRLVHPNLLPVVAYLYKKDEKLFVTEYMVNGSLAHLLHGGSSMAALDWPRRLKIIKGVTRGLAHLYDELPMLTVPHGHLKSSNVLLDAAFEPILSDYALVPVMTPRHAAQVMVAYKSPECGETGRPSKKSDVWSLGILILEVLTGKFPANYHRQGRTGTDLAGWVHSVVREEWTGEVFDQEMRGARGGEGEMVKLLKVGLGCCESDVDKRWDLRDALARIEELRERDAGAGADDSSAASSVASGGGGGEASRSHSS
ncbi:pollen receptor-like kinase 5 [Oryza sativa Japonica Group]|uniref:Receptor-like protein kinase PRK1 n=1 Tax=Oryza sativa subsp. japonica TaxID=39947 RepID=Q654A3_ORYSJ|nr:pollen receptor-like kinase 5 [Oryza sativa Japonica Group]BAD45864.1 putative receptor-like protein kinase PRK1 [Oryza sativa Japonica Group]